MLANYNTSVVEIPGDIMVHIQATTRKLYVRLMGVFYLLATIVTSATTWYRVTVRREAGVVQIWLDGALLHSVVMGATINPAGSGIRIAWGMEKGNQYVFGGWLKQLQIRNGPAPDLTP
jgi:hypothetical protein